MLYKPLKRNIVLLYFINVLSGCVFFYPILALYLREQLFTVFNVTIIYAIITIGSAILEVPTGVFSDLVGRRVTVIAARVIDVVAVAFLAFGTQFWHFTLYAVAVAFTGALASGNDDALVYDSLTESGEEEKYKKVSGTLALCTAVSVGIASLAGGIVASDSLRLPAILTLIPFMLCIPIAFLLEEPASHRSTDLRFAAHARSALQSIGQSRTLFLLALVIILFDLIVEPVYQVLQIFYAENGLSIAYFGIAYGIAMGLRSIGSYFSHDVTMKVGDGKAMTAAIVLSCILTLAAGHLGGWMAIACMMVLGAVLGVAHPILQHLLHAQVQTHHRATVVSIINLFSSLGLTILVPGIGVLADRFNIFFAYKAFAWSYIFLFFVLFFHARQRHA